MKRRSRRLILPALLLLGVAARADVSMPAGDGPVAVRVALSVLDIDAVDAVEQSFVANVYLEARWHDARLAHDQPGERALPLDQVWHPRLQFVNQQRVVSSLPRVVEVAPDGEVALRVRVWGPFSQPLDVEDFPFDEQSFELLLTAAGFETTEVAFVPDPERPSAMAPHFSVADWNVASLEAVGGSYELVPSAAIPVFRVTLRAERESNYFVFKIIVPLLLIGGMACTVFWLNPENASTQIGVATTSMLTLIAYRFTTGSYVPRVAYLTRMDVFLLGATVMVFLILAVAVSTVYLAAHGRLGAALSIERHCRWIFPGVFLALTVGAFLL